MQIIGYTHLTIYQKLDNYGNEIKYTVDEEDLGNKFYSKGTVDQTAMTVTNVSEYGESNSTPLHNGYQRNNYNN